MKVQVFPGRIQANTIKIPPSKSMAHRAIICAALAQGKSTITNVDYSVDIKTTIEGMRSLGAKIDMFDDYVVVEGIPDFNHLSAREIQCNESGTTLRFFIPIFSLCDQPVRFVGKNRLLKRPQSLYEEIFKQQGCRYMHNEQYIEVNGAIRGGELSIRGDVSSQFISGLLLALPHCKVDSRIHISAPFESKSYVDLTIQMMKKFGVHAYFEDDLTLVIPGNQRFIAHDECVEGDYSQLGFFGVLGAINQSLSCTGLSHDSLQGDKQLLDIFKAMNLNVESIDGGYHFHQSNAHATVMDMNNCPDLGPILSVLASFAHGKVKMINAGRLRIKESDRIAAMESELQKVGVRISSTYDEVFIEGPSVWKGNLEVSGHKDHRIVMAMAIGATMAQGPITISEAESISKSYPGFFDDLRSLGIRVEVLDDEN